MYNISQTNIFKNWDKDCYIASLLPPTLDDYGNELSVYDTPIKYKFNYQPVTSQLQLATLQADGINTNGLIRAMLDISYLDKIKVYDLAYLYDAIPENEKYNGEKANYRVVKFIPQNVKILVYFERLF